MDTNFVLVCMLIAAMVGGWFYMRRGNNVPQEDDVEEDGTMRTRIRHGNL
jgi:hypothetical protein